MYLINLLLIIFSLIIIFVEFRKTILSLRISKIAIQFLISISFLSILIYANTNNIIKALQSWLVLVFQVLFVNIFSLYIIKLSKKINKQIGFELICFIFFYCVSPIAIISMSYNGFPNELLISNCIISSVTLILILKYSVSIVMSKEIKKISLFHQLFLLLILMTGSIFSFANLNYSINLILGIISTNIKIVDYIFLYSSIFTLNYDCLVSQIWTDKLLASISMIYSYFFISTVFATIITRLNSNTA